MTKRVLVTGFEPFERAAVNPTELLVERLPEAYDGPHLLMLHVLPVVFDDAARQIRELVRSLKPDVVICTGVAVGAAAVRLERVAINLDDASIPDNSGARPRDEPIRVGGPVGYFSTLPMRRCQSAIERRRIPVEISNSAGMFVCNHVFYSLMDELASMDGSAVGGFVHVPDMPTLDGVCTGSRPTLPIEVTTAAICAVIEASAE